MNNYKKYLPSKKFISILLIIVVFLAIFFTIKGVISLFKSIKSNKPLGQPTTMVVGEIIQKDSNHNGIADWEEYLWGLDPTKNGPENKEFITSKKTALTQSGDISTPTDDSKTITDNEALSREFFATIVSLQQTGDLNQASIQSVSDAIGQKIVAVPLSDIYTRANLKFVTDSTTANTNYYNAFNSLVNKYANEDMGSELTLISQGLGNNDPQALFAVKTVAGAYKSFGSEFIKIPVPSSLSTIHLRMANDYYKIGESIDGLTVTLSDPIIGMRAIINYKKYSDELVADIEKLSTILQ